MLLPACPNYMDTLYDLPSNEFLCLSMQVSFLLNHQFMMREWHVMASCSWWFQYSRDWSTFVSVLCSSTTIIQFRSHQCASDVIRCYTSVIVNKSKLKLVHKGFSGVCCPVLCSLDLLPYTSHARCVVCIRLYTFHLCLFLPTLTSTDCEHTVYRCSLLQCVCVCVCVLFAVDDVTRRGASRPASEEARSTLLPAVANARKGRKLSPEGDQVSPAKKALVDSRNERVPNRPGLGPENVSHGEQFVFCSWRLILWLFMFQFQFVAFNFLRHATSCLHLLLLE